MISTNHLAPKSTNLQENVSLKDQIAKLEERIAAGMTSTDAQERAERRVRELAEERVQLIRDKQELQQRTLLLQEELSSGRDEGFVLVNDETRREQQVDNSKKVLEIYLLYFVSLYPSQF